MPDIFDQLDTPPDRSGGDVFDQVASPARDIFDELPTGNRFADMGRRVLEGASTGTGRTLQGARRGLEVLAPSEMTEDQFIASQLAGLNAKAFPNGLSPVTTPLTRADVPPAMLEQWRADYARQVGTVEQRLQESPTYQLGAETVEAARAVSGVDRNRDDEFLAQLATAAGEMVPTLAAGALGGPVAAGAQYAATAGESQAQEAIAAGQPEVADVAFLSAAGLGGLTEAALGVPGRLLAIVRRARQAGVNPGAFGKWANRNPILAGITKAGAAGAVREGTQEGLEQVGGNLIASDVAGYDPQRPVDEGVARAMALGAALGGPLAGGGAAVNQSARNMAARRLKQERAGRDVFDEVAAAVPKTGTEALNKTEAESGPDVQSLSKDVSKAEPVAVTRDLAAELQAALTGNQGKPVGEEGRGEKREDRPAQALPSTEPLRFRAIVEEGKVPSEMVVQPLTEELYDAVIHVEGLTPEFEQFKAENPEATHLRRLLMPTGKFASGHKFGPLNELVPQGIGSKWEQVEDRGKRVEDRPASPSVSPAKSKEVELADPQLKEPGQNFNTLLEQKPYDTSKLTSSEKLQHEKFLEGTFGLNPALDVQEVKEPKQLTPPTLAPTVTPAETETVTAGTAGREAGTQGGKEPTASPTPANSGLATEPGVSPGPISEISQAGRTSLGKAASTVSNGPYRRSTTTEADDLLHTLATLGLRLPYFKPDRGAVTDFEKLTAKARRNEPLTPKEKAALERFRRTFPVNFEDNYGAGGEIMEAAYKAAQRAGLAVELFTEQRGQLGGEWDTKLDALRQATGRDWTLRELYEALPPLAEGHRARVRGETSAEENAELDKRAEQDMAFQRDQRANLKNSELIPPDDLREGMSYTLRGRKLRVTDLDIDEDGRVVAVELEDGDRYGTQRLLAEDGSEVPALRADTGSAVGTASQKRAEQQDGGAFSRRSDRAGTGKIRKLVYHGSAVEFDGFDFSKAKDGAHFFTDNEMHAATFGNPKPFIVEMENPMIIGQTDLERRWDETVNDGGESGVLPRDMVALFVADAKRAGFDGLVIKDMADRDIEADMYLPFRADQISPPTESAATTAPRTGLPSREEIGTRRGENFQNSSAEQQEDGAFSRKSTSAGRDRATVNWELNQLKAKATRTPTENARITALEAELGQQDLFAVETRDVAEIEREAKAKADKAELERRRAERLTAAPIEVQDNLFGEPLADKAGQGMFFSRGTGSGVSVEAAQARADELTARWVLPFGVEVVQSWRDLPARAQRGITEQDGHTVEGRYVPGSGVFLVADNLASPDRVAAVVLHEVLGHFGIDTVLGEQRDDFMLDVFRSFQGKPLFQQKVRDYAGDFENGRTPVTQADKILLGRELVAALAENPAENPGLWQRIVDAVRRWLREIGWVQDVTEADIREALRRAEAALRGVRSEELGVRSPGLVNMGGGVLMTPGAQLVDVRPDALAALTAHHGTPHKVDRFTTAKIGTGEGAQVYGWGLYFAENEQVATQYKNKLGTATEETSRLWPKVREAIKTDLNTTRAQELIPDIENTPESRWTTDFGVSEKTVELLRAYFKTKQGQIYTVTLNAEPEDLLDWDKPLSEQSEKVRSGLQELGIERKTVTHPEIPDPDWGEIGKQTAGTSFEWNPNGRQAYDFLSRPSWKDRGNNPSEMASRLLANVGIKGIRYLDQGSRLNPKTIEEARARVVIAKRDVEESPQNKFRLTILQDEEKRLADLLAQAQRNTYNYVIFNEEDIRITHENGQPVAAGQFSRRNKVITGAERARNFANWFRNSKVVNADGTPRVVYHGSKRPDRIGTKFLKKRATSGPMAFFTDDPEIASKYATGKQDTSLVHPEDYYGWFKFKPPGSRSSVTIDRAWWFLSAEQRAKLADTLPRVSGTDENGDSLPDGQYRLTEPGETGLMPKDSWDYELRQARGNSLKAAVEAWLNSGALFNREDEFLDVLRTAGLNGVEFDSPWAEYSGVFPVHLSIQNPLNTAAIPENVLAELNSVGKRKRARGQYGADQWDKNTVSGPDWLERLNNDQKDGTAHAWTSIPDWVTDTLIGLGYDGIQDTGGKQGGPAHGVWIPFFESQVKSATGNRGTFDPESNDMTFSRTTQPTEPLADLLARRDEAAARGITYTAQREKLRAAGKSIPDSLKRAEREQADIFKETSFQLLRHPDYVAQQVRAVDAKLDELNTLVERRRILKQQGTDLDSDARARLAELEHWLPIETGEEAVPFQHADEFAGIPPSLVKQAIERTPGLKHFVTEADKKRMRAILDNPNLTQAQKEKALEDLERNRGRQLAEVPLPNALPPRANVALATSTTLAGNQDARGWWESFARYARNLASATPEIPLFGPLARLNVPMRGFLNAIRAGNMTAARDAETMVRDVVQPLLDLPREQLDPNALARHQAIAKKLQFAERQFDQQAERMRAEIAAMEQARASRDAINERREALAEFEGNPPAKIAELQKQLAEAVNNLGTNPMWLFKQAVLFRDYVSRFQMLAPKQQGRFKFPGNLSIQDVVNELARTEEAIEASPARVAIKEAMDRHYRAMTELEGELLKRGHLIPEAMKNGAYFPHQVLDYTSQHLGRLKPATDAPFRGYLVDPTGSRKAIETDYIQAVYRHAAEVMAHNAHQDAVEKYLKPLDRSESIRETVEAKAAAEGRTAGRFEWRSEDNLPPGFVFYDAAKKLPLRLGYVLDPQTIAQALGIALKDGDVVEQMRKLGVDFVVEPEMLQQALVAGEKQPWVIPKEVAEALDGILDRQKREEAAARAPVTRRLRQAVALWKLNTLFAPWHYIRYEWGNTMSDIVDKLGGADPGMAKYLPQAFKEVIAFADRKEATKDVRAAFEQRVLDSVTFAEVEKVKDSPAFEQLRSDTQRALATAGNFAKDATFPAIPIIRLLSGANVRSTVELSRLREATFRYAKFLADLDRIRNGQRPVYAGAYWKDVEAEGTPEEKAAFIARRTFGDYGDLSVAGDWLRQNLVPFYSWTEINFRYHANLLRNMADMIRKGEFGDAAQSARAIAAWTALRLALPYAAVHLWNTIGGAMAGAWDDDDDLEATLSEADRRRFHIILGKDDRGQTRVVYLPTAFSDVVSWFGGDNAARLLAEYARGEITFERVVGDFAKQIGPDVVNKVAQSTGPVGKGAFIAVSGKQPFPDITNMRSVSGREKWFAVVQTMTDREGTDLLRRAFDNDYYPRPAGEVAQQLILQIRRRDPEQWAFYEVKEKVSDWKERKTGKRFEAGDYSAPEAQALRSFRRAVYLGDVDAAERFYTRLLGFGYTSERLKASIRNQHPLAELNEEGRKEFIKGLSRADREQLRRALQYWERLGTLKGKERGLFPAKVGQRFTPQPERLQRAVLDFDRKSDEEVRRTAERLVESALTGRR